MPESRKRGRRLSHRIERLGQLDWRMAVGMVLLSASVARAQFCFFYVDNEDALTPIECVQKADHSLPCAWMTDCDSIVASSPQTVLRFHTLWHQCFGNTGGLNPPPGRGERWYAFHRQFEVDFNRWREPIGLAKIESLEWCPNMVMPVGHPSAQPGGIPGHPAFCGNGIPRPDSDPGPDGVFDTPDDGIVVRCTDCEAFPACLFYEGAGPIGCPPGDDFRCPVGITALEQFPNIDEIAEVLDSYYHGAMHGAVGNADGRHCVDAMGNVGGSCDFSSDCAPGETCIPYVDDQGPNCSPRDPMFWRLHKALDDVVRAWQDNKAVDVMLVIDRSGSMSDLDSGGMTKLDAALEAVDMFADLLELDRNDGQANRIGVVSYSDGASLHMPLTDADANLRAAGGPLETAINAIQAIGPGGCTGIGAGIQEALKQLCPTDPGADGVLGTADDGPGNCQNFMAAGDNDRKAILLLTDGMENRPPCLNSIDPAPSGFCGSTCSGDQFEFDTLEFTQLVAVGFGNSGSLNGDLLTLVAERQGGIYMQNPNTAGDDLKDFFAKAFGRLTDEFLGLDPKGVLGGTDSVSEPIEYTACGDSKITFVSGWKDPVQPGELRLLVTSPSGDLVAQDDPAVQASMEATWDYTRIRLPYRGESRGTWRANLIRPHQIYVNGFAPDSFAKPAEGVAIVRRQIQRLCPDGCRNVLYFEAGRRGRESAYELALKAESEAGLVRSIESTNDPDRFAALLESGPWDLIVYAYMGDDRPLRSDRSLADLLCKGQRAILTDTRPSAQGNVLECARVGLDGTRNWRVMVGDRRLVDGSIQFDNPGHEIFTYGLVGTQGTNVQATIESQRGAAIVARTAIGKPQHWFVDVLVRGLSKLDPHLTESIWKAGDDLVASVRMLPSYIRAGGYDRVDARVEVEFPLVGLGAAVREQGLGDEIKVEGETLDRRAAVLAGLTIPTSIETYPLFDDGTNGDIHPGNLFWTTILPGLGRVDGMYKFRFLFDFTVDGCTTRRELTQSVFVDLQTDPNESKVDVGRPSALPDGRLLTPIQIVPLDPLQNPWGPGRPGVVTCGPRGECDVDTRLVDEGDGSYTINVATAPGVASVRLNAFGTSFDAPIPCDDCPSLRALVLDSERVLEDTEAKGEVRLSGPAPRAGVGGALVYLESDNPLLVSVPESLVVPAGTTAESFPILIHHIHRPDERLDATISASYGGQVVRTSLTVVPGSRDVPRAPELIHIMDGVGTQFAMGSPDTFIAPQSDHIGFDRFTLRASEDVVLNASDLVFTGPRQHRITDFVNEGGGLHTIVLDQDIEPGHWLRLRLEVSGRGTGITATFVVWVAYHPNDIDQDGVVNIRDATAFGDVFRAEASLLLVDLNGDGVVNVRDATAFGTTWNGVPPATRAWRDSSLPPKPD